ncbi:MAG: sulfatase-like hydrolase/transferase [Eubacteriaceae bacterium]|nr:sulfatase-like hydrolase/transferase [Eubacteriaceae bacterium]
MSKLKTFYKKYLHSYIGICVVLAIAITLIIETLARQTIYGGVVFMVTHPLVFLYNAVIVFVCMSIGLLFRHRMFVTIIVSATWLVLGIVNGIILSNRMTPFTTGDIAEVKDGLTLVSNYMSKTQIVLLIAGAVALVLLIIFLFRKVPKLQSKIHYKSAIPAFLIIVLIGASCTGLVVKTKVVDTYFPNLAYGYRDNGFSYCFLATWLDKGVSKPDNYSAKSIRSIFTKKELDTTVGDTKNDGGEKHPNIIFLQLESFIDPDIVSDIKLDKDPIPNYRKLSKNYSSGKLHVPSVGAGTANTEFENMTGMSVKFFGPGEYPYKTILHDETCESIPYNLRNIGYSTHAIHNHRAAFYGRNKVFGNLGFETFTSLEYMSDVSKTPKNWARDNVLTSQMTDAMGSTKGSDYIYTISVQGHGKYPTEEVIKDPEVTVTSAPTQELKWQWEYYVNQINEMDTFIGKLTKTLESYDEDVVLVMYGDHLPAIDNLTEENVKGRSIYQTDYVIWSNFKMDNKKEDLYSYQLGAELLDRLDIHNGTMVTYHQNHKNDKNYLKNLEALQYDMLYGKRYIYGNSGTTPFKNTGLKMGVKDVKIDKVVKIGEKYYIKGQNFTEYSKVNLDGKILKTVYLGPTLLGLKEEVDPKDASKMKISQVEKNNEILSTSE